MSFSQVNKPLVYFITDGTLSAENFDENCENTLSAISAAVSANVPLVQIREKSLPARLVFELTVRAAEIADGTASKILVNDRADVAKASGAHGVHLTTNSLSVKTIRRCFGIDFLIGVSTHYIDEIVSARENGADFAVFGPVYETPGKGAPTGLAELRRAVDIADGFPVIALGGIDETNYRDVLEIADGFAAIRFLNDRAKLAALTSGKQND